MADSHSSEESDSSPTAFSSSSRDDNLAVSGAMPPVDSNADPESPNAAQQSSDESGCSDGVLVELPGNNDQDSRSMPGDSETGILVNIDGSMQEQQEREDFIDASDHLGSGSRTPRLGESVTMIEPVDASRRRRSREQDLERSQARINAMVTECRMYKEERDAFGREVLSLRSQLQGLIDHNFLNSKELPEYHRLPENREPELDVLSSPSLLHSIVEDCSKIVVHLKCVLDEHLNSEAVALNSKDQEIEVLCSKVFEDDIFQNVLMSCLSSARGECLQSMDEFTNAITRRLIASLPVMNGTETVASNESFVDGISLIEKRTMLLVEKHNQLLDEIKQLGQFVEEIHPGSLSAQHNELGLVFALAREELLESKKKEGELEGKIQVLEEENTNLFGQIISLNKTKEEMDSDMSNLKTELEQTESKFLAAKEKLSIAVAKGKQLVQHRDSLKHSLTDKTNALEMMETSNEEIQQMLSVKTNELEKCILELQNKSNILVRNEATIEDLKHLLQEKADELEKCLQELQKKSDALENANRDVEELRELLVENKGRLENSLLQLQQRSKELDNFVANFEEMRQFFTVKICELDMSLLYLEQNCDALGTAEATIQQLKQALSVKEIELEKSLLELQEKSNLIVATQKQFNELQNLVLSLEDLAACRDKVLKEMEETTSDVNFPQELPLDIVDKYRWLVTRAHMLDDILQENCRVKDALFSVSLPQAIASAKLDSQVDWLVRSFTQTKGEVSRLQSEVTHTSTLHESELSDALKEVDSLAESLLKEKKEKEFQLIENEHLKVGYEKLAKNLALISSEKEKIVEFLKEICTTYLDDQPTFDIDTLLEKSSFFLRKNLISLNDVKKFDKLQTMLHVTYVERTLFEKVLEEVEVDWSRLIILSNELGIVSKEISDLRNEKISMQKEVERVEERNSLLRDKLSMAVKKGKGLVQEREVLKLTLDEKNAQIEKLKEELHLQESKVHECIEQIKSLSGYPEQLLKLELDIASLNVKREQSEHLLSERNDNLQKLIDSINNIALRTDKVFEAPIDKVNWISGCISETENAKAFLSQELEKTKRDANLNSNRYTEALNTMKSLEIELEYKKKHMHDLSDEMNDIRVTKAKIEEDLEKAREESFIQVNNLSDAHATIKFLEDKLLLTEDKVIALVAEKSEIVSKSNLEISALNAKMAEIGEELVKTMDSSENQLVDLLSELKQLEIFMKNEGLFPLIFEHFHKKAEGLRNMWMLIQDIHVNLRTKDANICSQMESVLTNLSSLTNFEDFTKYEKFHTGIFDDTGAVTTCKRIVKEIFQGARFLNDEFKGLSMYMDDYIAFTLQALEASRDQFIHTLHLSEFLKLDIEKLEERSQAQEFEISSLQTEALMLLSKCKDATEELQVKFSDSLGVGSFPESVQSGLHLRSPASSRDMVEKVKVGEFSQPAENLLLTCREITVQYQNLAKINKEMSFSLENLQDKLNHADMIAATTLDEKKIIQEKILKLEGDMEALQNLCNEMKSKLNDYQSKENVFKEKSNELQLLEYSLSVKGRGNEKITRDQVEVLFEKVNKLTVLASSSNQSDSQSQEVFFSNSVDKLFYVVEKFSEFQQGVLSLAFEKQDLQLIIANHVHEIENLEGSVESLKTQNQDLQSKKWQLNEVTSILEKITQRIAEHYPFEDLRPVTAVGLIQVLDRQLTALILDLEKSKTELHELRGKLQSSDMFISELSAKVKYLEDSHARIQQPDVVKERTVFESLSTTMRPEITEIEEGSVGLSLKNPISASAHVRTMRKGSNDHLVLSIDSESERLLTAHETDDKGHVFKSLNTSGLIPKQGRLIADRVDGIWVSGGRILMGKPAARLGIIAYWIFLHLWVLGSIL